jgi:hypothetical protein
MSVLRIALLVLDAFVALTAIGGGLALASGVEGKRFPLEYLRGTPFTSFVVPGLILAVALGGSADVASAATIVDAELGAMLSICAGVILVGYIAVEIAILDQPSWTRAEAFYLTVGLAMLGPGALELTVA